MAHVLKNRGYRVLDAESGEAALVAAQALAVPPNLLLTDTVLPGMSGPELAHRLRSDWPEIKVIFVSGYTDDTMVRHGLLEPDLPFLQKPFSPAALEQKVSDVLAAHSS
jgi:CheY-like chemotaxis protein